MKQCGTTLTVLLGLVAFVTADVGTALAQDAEEREPGWSDTAELTTVFTNGNAESSTLGFKNELTRTWTSSVLAFSVGALRAESSRITRRAVGASPTDFQVVKESVTTLTAESYYARGQYDRELSERTFWYTGLGWERNTFAGVENRYSWGGGVGNAWIDDEMSTFKTSYGVTYTRQDDVVGTDRTFAGLQVSYDYRREVTSNTEFTSIFLVNENVKDTEDFRTDLVNAVAVSMSSQLALKVSWQVLYDRQPSLVSLPLVTVGGVPTGQTVLTDLSTVDNLVTFALVATF